MRSYLLWFIRSQWSIIGLGGALYTSEGSVDLRETQQNLEGPVDPERSSRP